MSIDHGDANKSLGGKRTYTVEEIAKILGIGRTAAYNLVHSGVFKMVRIGSLQHCKGRNALFLRIDIAKRST